MKTKKALHRAACIAALSVCVATPALAKDPGFFLGFDLGQSKLDVETVSVPGLFTSTTGVRQDDTDQAFSLNFGYRLNNYLGIELSLRDFGKAASTEVGFGRDTRSATFQTAVGPPPVFTTISQTRPTAGMVEIEQEAEGMALSVVGSLPLQKFELYGKLGLLYSKTTVSARITSISSNSASTVAGCGLAATTTVTGCTWALPISGLGSESSKSTGAMFAIGAGYTFADEISFRVEWTRAGGLGDEDELGFDEFDVNVISAGFQYRF